MSTTLDPLSVDRQFFASLMEANIPAIDRVLTDDFFLIDVMHGNEISKSELLAALQSGDLKFESIELADVRLRSYPGTAIVTGRTRMSIKFQATSIEVNSRYTHVYVEEQGNWRLASGQGTQISDS